MTALTSLGLFIFAVICYAIKELHSFGKLNWQKEGTGFWGGSSYLRKYKKAVGKSTALIAAPNNWYYRFFKIKYKERFPLSATLLVSLTDAPHALQLTFKLLLIGSMVSYKEMVNPWVDGLIYFGIWGIVFTIVYKELSK